MSRRMVAPGVWLIEAPEVVHLRARSAYANVPASTIPDMRPVLTYSQPQMKSGYRQKALRVKP